MGNYTNRAFTNLYRSQAIPNDNYGLDSVVDGFMDVPPSTPQIGGVSLAPKQWVASNGTTSVSNTLIGCLPGSYLVLTIAQGDDATVPNATSVTGGSLSWSKIADAQAVSSANAEIWGAYFPAGGSITVTTTWTGSTRMSCVLTEVSNPEASFGGSVPTPLTGQTLPSLSITTTRNDSVVIGVISDWLFIDGTNRRYRSDAKELFYERIDTFYTAYHFLEFFPEIGTYDFGLTNPSSPSAGMGMALVEIREAATGAQSLSLPLMASTETLYAPTLLPQAVSLALPAIASTEALYAPTLVPQAVTISLPAISSSEIMYAPTILPGSVNLVLPLISSAETLFVPTLSAGPVSLALPLLGSGEALYAPTIVPGAVAVALPLISSTEALYPPALTAGALSLQLPLITSTQTLFAPTLLPQAVTLLLPLIGSTQALYAPTITQPGLNYHYIDPTGNNTTGDGSIGNPWLTLKKACDTVTTSGHTIYVNAGTYIETAQCSLSVGVNITGAGDTSILKSTLTANFTAMLVLSSGSITNGNQSISYVKFDGQYVSEASRGTNQGIYIAKRNNVEIKNCTITGFYDRGVIFANQEGADLSEPATNCTGNSFHDNTLTNCAAYNTSYGVYGRGCLNFGGQTGMLIYNNTIIQNQRVQGYNGWPIKGWNDGWNKGCKIYDNIITKIPFTGTYAGENGWPFAIELFFENGLEIYGNTIQGAIDTNFQSKGAYAYSMWIHDNVFSQPTLTDKDEAGITLEYQTEDIIIENNTFSNVAFGIMFVPRTGYPISNVTIRKNLFYNIGKQGVNGNNGGAIHFYSDNADHTIDGFYVYNNTFVAKSGSAAQGGMRFNGSGTTTNLQIKNNIFQNWQQSWLWVWSSNLFSNMAVTNNRVYNNGSSNNPYYQAGTPTTSYTYSSNTIGTPGFNNEAGNDYTLSSGSACRDTGVDVGIAYDGSAPDIGYAEFDSGSLTLSVPKITNTSTLYGPTLTPGAVSLSVPLIGSTSALYAPTVAPDQDLSLSFIDSTGQLFVPTLVQTGVSLYLPLIDSAEIMYPPVVDAHGTLYIPFISSSGALYAPTVIGGATITIVRGSVIVETSQKWKCKIEV